MHYANIMETVLHTRPTDISVDVHPPTSVWAPLTEFLTPNDHAFDFDRHLYVELDTSTTLDDEIRLMIEQARDLGSERGR